VKVKSLQLLGEIGLIEVFFSWFLGKIGGYCTAGFAGNYIGFSSK